MVISGNRNHSRIVCSKLEFRQIRVPATFLALECDPFAEAAVGRYSAANGNLPYAGLLRRLDELVQQYVNEGFLEAGADILLVLLHEFRVLGNLVPDEVEQ